jgi:indole-3-glycerol phosphate synthase
MLTSESGVAGFQDVHNFEKLSADVAFVTELFLRHVVDEETRHLAI